MPYERKTSDIQISDKFKSVLELFKDESEHAKLLLQRRILKSLLQEDHINYFDIAKSDVMKISYLSSDRIGTISQSDTFDFWSTNRRYMCKPGAFLNKVFKDVSNKDVEKFSTLWKTFAKEKEFRFEIVSGEDVRKYYHYINSHDDSGSIGNSCMKYSKCQSYLDIYVDNPNIKLLVMLNNETNKVMGRSLLLKTVDGVNVMDRIYTTNDDELMYHFRKWSSENGYICKAYSTWYQTLQFKSNDVENEYRLSVKLDRVDYDLYPYFDTFKWLDKKSKHIYNYMPSYFLSDEENFKYFKCLNSPEGGQFAHNELAIDDITREVCGLSNLVTIVTVDGRTISTSSSNANYSNANNAWLLPSESQWNSKVDDYIYTDLSRNDINGIKRRIIYVGGRRGNSITSVFRDFNSDFGPLGEDYWKGISERFWEEMSILPILADGLRLV